MSRILIAWELGANLGHVAQLAPIAARLDEEGHDLLFAVKDIAAAQQYLRGKCTRIVQAPVARETPRREPAVSYADMLDTVGYTDAGSISALLRGWLDQFMLSDPEVVVADHAPTALLAARVAGLPKADVSFGFTRPPRTHPLPSIQPKREFPAGDRPRVVAYLRSSPVLETTLEAIVANDAAALCHIPDAAPDLIERYAPRESTSAASRQRSAPPCRAHMRAWAMAAMVSSLPRYSPACPA